jgi:peptide/nickel transport system permease protein
LSTATLGVRRPAVQGRGVNLDHLSYWQRSWRALRRNRLGMLAGLIVLLEGLIALLAPFLAQHLTGWEPNRQNLTEVLAPPGRGHWLGTDELGRDTLTRLMYGARVSLGVAILAVSLSTVLGTTVGIVAGFYGKIVDGVLMRLVDVLLATPPIFFYIMLAILFRPNAIGLALVLASLGWSSTARLVRAEVLVAGRLDFILAARALGADDRRVMFMHILPSTIPVILVAASLAIASVILTEAALSFLVGIVPPDASWGNMITAARTYFTRALYVAIFPGIAIFVTVLAINLFGNALRDVLDPRLNSS